MFYTKRGIVATAHRCSEKGSDVTQVTVRISAPLLGLDWCKLSVRETLNENLQTDPSVGRGGVRHCSSVDKSSGLRET